MKTPCPGQHCRPRRFANSLCIPQHNPRPDSLLPQETQASLYQVGALHWATGSHPAWPISAAVFLSLALPADCTAQDQGNRTAGEAAGAETCSGSPFPTAQQVRLRHASQQQLIECSPSNACQSTRSGSQPKTLLRHKRLPTAGLCRGLTVGRGRVPTHSH